MLQIIDSEISPAPSHVAFKVGPDSRKVGGVSGQSVAASANVTNTTDETAFDKTVTIPANTLRAGEKIKIRGFGTVPTTNSTDTLTIKVKIGSTVLLATAAVDVADGDVFMFDIDVFIRTAGASGTFVAMASYQDPDAAGTAPKMAVKQETAIDTTAEQEISVTATWSAASASDIVRLDALSVGVNQ